MTSINLQHLRYKGNLLAECKEGKGNVSFYSFSYLDYNYWNRTEVDSVSVIFWFGWASLFLLVSKALSLKGHPQFHFTTLDTISTYNTAGNNNMGDLEEHCSVFHPCSTQPKAQTQTPQELSTFPQSLIFISHKSHLPQNCQIMKRSSPSCKFVIERLSRTRDVPLRSGKRF